MSGDAIGNAALIALLAIVPLVVLMLTSFVKISVVLALLRNAIGAPDAPSGLVVMGLSLVLTFFVMAPVGVDMIRAAAGDTGADVPAPKPGAPNPGAPKPDAPRPGAARPDAPKPDAPNPGAAPSGALTPGAPSPGSTTPGAPVDPYASGPAPNAMGSNAPGSNAPTPNAPTPNTAGSNAPAPNAPTPNAPTPNAPTPNAPTPTPDAPAPGPQGGIPLGAPPLDLDAAMRRIVPAKYAKEIDAATRAVGPLQGFLAKHADPRDRETFVGLAGRMGRASTGDELWVLAPAFLTTELREAFAIAVLIFVPFLVIDLIVGLALAALGLATTQPQTITLPLKLLLFVAVDGWRLLVDSLLRGYV